MISEFALIENDQIHDSELERLLFDVYVGGEYTDARDADALLNALNVRKRGLLLGLRHKMSEALAGVIILVPPESDAIKMASGNEAEVHLLGVSHDFRKQGVGKRLIEALIMKAKHKKYTALILWTQASMSAAQKLYTRCGFQQTGSFVKNDKAFQTYRFDLS